MFLSFTSMNSPTMEQKQYFRSVVGIPGMQRDDCVHCSAPFCIRNLNICGVWCPRGPGINLQLTPRDSTVLGSQQLYLDFQLCRVGREVVSILNPRVVQGSIVFFKNDSVLNRLYDWMMFWGFPSSHVINLVPLLYHIRHAFHLQYRTMEFLQISSKLTGICLWMRVVDRGEYKNLMIA